MPGTLPARQRAADRPRLPVVARWLVWLAASLGGQPALAYTVTIKPGAKAIYLQIGDGTYTGGNASNGGTPANNATVNTVTVTVPLASVGNGTAQTMTSNSAASTSFIDGFAVCTDPAQVYIGAWTRFGSGQGQAVLSVSTPNDLASGANTIPFSQIGWTASSNRAGAATFPSGAFAGGTQTLVTFTADTWKEDCLTFRYANTVLAAGGTYSGRATYTLVLP